MKIYYREWQQLVPGSMEQVWSFFSRPENLQKITPPDMDFEIRTKLEGVEMYPGILIQYKVTPFPGFKTNWVTEITSVERHRFFIDEQRFGPFKLWHHQHHFEQGANGVRMTDILHYAVPLDPFGRLINRLAIGPRIDRIFAYRKSVIPTYFPGTI